MGCDDARETREAGLNSRLEHAAGRNTVGGNCRISTPIMRGVLRIARHYGVEFKAYRSRARQRAPIASTPIISMSCKATGRNDLMAHLAADQIGSAAHYPIPVHRQQGYAEKVVVPEGGLPVTDKLADRILSLPIYPELSGRDADRVIASIRRSFDE